MVLRVPLLCSLAWLSIALPVVGQTASAPSADEESLTVYTEHPRLLLTKHRLRLLQKERERHSMRQWQEMER